MTAVAFIFIDNCAAAFPSLDPKIISFGFCSLGSRAPCSPPWTVFQRRETLSYCCSPCESKFFLEKKEAEDTSRRVPSRLILQATMWLQMVVNVCLGVVGGAIGWLLWSRLFPLASSTARFRKLEKDLGR